MQLIAQRKILVIPTYFPLKSSPIVGSQVQEQLELLIDEFNIRVIYCMPGMGWKRFIFFILAKVIRKNIYQNCSDVFISQNILVKGVYFFQNKWFPNWLNQKLFYDAFDYAYLELNREKWTADLIHSRGFDYGGIAALFLKRKYNIPYIHTENTAFLFDNTFSISLLKLYKEVLSNANQLLFVSTFLMRNTLMHGFLDNSSCQIVGNPVNENMFKIEPNKSDQLFTIFTTGYYSFIKDFNTLFQAIKIVINEGHENIKLIIGVTYLDSQTLTQFRDRISYYQIEDKVELVPKIPRNKIPQFLNSSHLYVSTSLIETFGIGALEALFCGIPVLSTSNGGIDDFLTDENGIKVDIRDPKALADSIILLKTEKKVFNSLAIRNSVIDKFGTVAFKKKLYGIYSKI